MPRAVPLSISTCARRRCSAVIVPDPTLNEVRFIDRAARREIGRLSLAGAPQGIAITPDGRHVFQSLSAEARVAILDPASRTVVGHLTVGTTPDGVAYTTRVLDAGAPQR